MKSGRVFIEGIERARAQIAAAPDDQTRIQAHYKKNLFAAGWDDFQLASWLFLWNIRSETLFSFSILGITIIRKTWEDLASVWSIPFGPCPFSWKGGPDAS